MIVLSGPVGPGLEMILVSRPAAFAYIKKGQLKEIKRDSQVHICRELDCAREILRDPTVKSNRVSFVRTTSQRNLLTVIYTISKTFPTVYTVHAMARNPDNDQAVSFPELEIILENMVTVRRGFLQTYPLKTVALGMYIAESYAENQFSAADER